MTPLYATYSFQDVVCTYEGPFSNFTVAAVETASAEEGITLTWGEESNTQTIGSDGSVMNSMHAARAGTCTIRLLKTSPNNRRMDESFRREHESSLFWGRSIIRVADVIRGDQYTLTGCAWVRYPTNSYAKIGNILEYEFHVAIIDSVLGPGAPDGH
jgi:hypothetical protein